MATFWTGAALAADYSHGRIRFLADSMVSGHLPAQRKIAARREAFCCVNRAIAAAIQAQLDEQPASPCADDDADDGLLHADGSGWCYPAIPRAESVMNAAEW